MNVPAGQKVHLLALKMSLNVPAGHFEQLGLPFVELYVPGEHALQFKAV